MGRGGQDYTVNDLVVFGGFFDFHVTNRVWIFFQQPYQPFELEISDLQGGLKADNFPQLMRGDEIAVPFRRQQIQAKLLLEFEQVRVVTGRAGSRFEDCQAIFPLAVLFEFID